MAFFKSSSVRDKAVKKISEFIQPLPIKRSSRFSSITCLGILAHFTKYLVLAKLINLNKFFKPFLLLEIILTCHSLTISLVSNSSVIFSKSFKVLIFSIFSSCFSIL